MNTFSGVNSVTFNKKFNSAYSALGSGVNNDVYVVVLSGDNLYVGGAFTTAGGISANRVAVWNITTSTWSSLGSGVNGDVKTIYADPTGNIYVGGSFTSAGGVANTNGIARWNSVLSTWFAMGTGVSASGIVWSISALSTTDIYVGGAFSSAGGVANTLNVARFINGTTWTAMGTGCNQRILFLHVLTLTNVYACGDFTAAGGVANTSRVAMWNGTAWTAMGTGTNSSTIGIYALSPTEVYTTGAFTNAGGVSANAIARWNGLAWNAMGTGFAGTTLQGRIVDTKGGFLYAVGWFNSAGGVANTRGIARWNISSSQWSNVGLGITDGVGLVYAVIARTSGSGFVGGSFTSIGGISCSSIARFDTPEITIQKWNPLGAQALDLYTFAIHWTSANSIYVGGAMTQIGGLTVNYIARWDGVSWSTLGAGVNGNVRAIYAYDSSNLLVGGQFTSAGGVANTQYIARWNTVDASWSSVASVGANNVVWAIHGFNSINLFVGGQFTQISGVSANGIARWSAVDASWSTLTTGISGAGAAVYAIYALSASNVYVGGDFTTAGGSARAYIARWDGTSWNAMGTGTNNIVRSISAVDSSNVYVGGQFTLAGGVANTTCIARWNGTAWIAMGTGTNYWVWAVSAPDRNNIFIAGLFTAVSGITGINRVARWDATNFTWNALGTGMNSETYEIDAFNANNVYVGGAFTTANSVSSPYIAKWEGDLTIPTPRPATLYSPPASWRRLNYGNQSGPGVQTLSIYRVDDFNVYVASGHNIWRYNGYTWTQIGTGNSTVWSIHSFNDGQTLYAIGLFTTMSGVTCNYVARYNGSSWSAFGSGLSNTGRSVIYAVDSSNIFIGGQVFGNSQNIRKYNSATNTWTALNTIGEVYTLGYFNSLLYVAGSDGQVRTYNISSGTWGTVGSNRGNRVYGMYVLNASAIYITGYVNPQRWNGSSWIQMSTGGGEGIAAFDANNVFRGTSGAAGGILKWNGTSWATFAGGAGALVYAIVPTGADSVYIGGDFGTSGGVGGSASFGVAYYT